MFAKSDGVFHQQGQRPAVRSMMIAAFIELVFSLLDVVCWASIGCKDTHVKSSMVLEYALVADTIMPFLQTQFA